MTQTCTLTVRTSGDTGGRDEYGNVIADLSTVTDVPCLLQQSQNISLRGEGGQVGEIQAETFRLFLPATVTGLDEDDDELVVDPDGVDAVEVDGITYEMAGPPWRVFNPRLRKVSHVEGTLRRSG